MEKKLVILSIFLGIFIVISVIFVILFTTEKTKSSCAPCPPPAPPTPCPAQDKNPLTYPTGDQLTFVAKTEKTLLPNPILAGYEIPSQYNLSGQLPAGLVFTSTTGAIEGALAFFTQDPWPVEVIGILKDGYSYYSRFNLHFVDAIPIFTYPTIPATGIYVGAIGTVINYPAVGNQPTPLVQKWTIGDAGFAFTYGLTFSTTTGNFGGTINADGQLGFDKLAPITVTNGDGVTQKLSVRIYNT